MFKVSLVEMDGLCRAALLKFGPPSSLPGIAGPKGDEAGPGGYTSEKSAIGIDRI